MKFDALVVIDVQTSLVNAHPYQEETLIQNIQKLLKECREKQIPVIYVRHDGGKNDELEAGTDGWQIYHAIAPQPEDKVIDKRFNSSFRQTDLREYLESIHAKNLILCGMQTEYCIDASCKVAFEYEYKVTIAKGTTSTYDTTIACAKDLIEYYEERIWKNRYASVISLEELVQEIKQN
ncbi:MAG: cysteine hydrolase family protein [Clostridiales bacterium]|nr:cysteine hydrolase family protein [Clostridiales bacterium]